MKDRMLVKKNTARKYGFFFSLTIMIGSIVGIGIFFKNYQVFNAVSGDSTLIISAWILGAVVAMITALSFVDIARLSLQTKMPFRKWCSMFVSKKYADFVGIVALMYAYALILPTLYYYSYSFMIQAFGGTPTLAGSIIALIIIPLGLFTLNILGEKGSAIFSQITTFLKVLPLILVAVIGLFFTSNGGGFASDHTIYNSALPSSSTLLLALPPILFTFDGFLTMTNVSHKINNPKKNTPLTLILGMALIAALYLLVTVSQINHATPTIQMTLNQLFKNNSLTRVTLFFIAISAFGVSNVITMSARITCQSLIDDNILPFSSFFRNRFHSGTDTSGGVVMMIVTIISAIILMLIQSVLVGGGFIDELARVKNNAEARNTSLVIDEFSNYPTYFFYPIYCSVIIGNLVALMRNKLRINASKTDHLAFKKLLHDTSPRRKNIIMIISICSATLIILIIAIHFGYSLLYQRIIIPLDKTGSLTADAKLDILMFLINLWLFQFIPFICLFSQHYKKSKKTFILKKIISCKIRKRRQYES